MNIVYNLSLTVTIVSSLIATSYCYYNDYSYSRGYGNYRAQYGGYRARSVYRKSYGRGYQDSYGELQAKPVVYPNSYGRYQHPAHLPEPQPHYPIEPQIPFSPDLEPDYNWYKEQEYKQMLHSSVPKKYGKYYEGMTFYSKSKPIYVEKKPIVKIIKQPVYVKQPIVIKKQPVIHKEEVVTVDKKPAVVTEVKVPVVEVKPEVPVPPVGDVKPETEPELDIDRRTSKKQLEKEVVKEEKPVVMPEVVDKPVTVDKPAVVDKPVVVDKHEKGEGKEEKIEKDEKKPLPELEDP